MKVLRFIFFLIVSFVSIEAQNKDIVVHVVTWNVNEKSAPNDLNEFLGLNNGTKPDIIIIGLQEVTMSIIKAAVHAVASDEWSKAFRTKLQDDYEHVETESTVGIILNVFVKKEHAWSLESIAKVVKKTGFYGWVGNKGGVIIRFDLYQQTFCIVNAHFHAHEGDNKKRISDYNKINEKRNKLCNNVNDYVFWIGDLNFRVEHPTWKAEKIEEIINAGNYTELLPYDELTMTSAVGNVFNGFYEPLITFKPTYKLIVGGTRYNLKRKPSWTDRILYKSDRDRIIETIFYRSMDSFTISDHKPVLGQFKINVDTTS